MTVDPTRSSRATRQGSRPAAGAGEAPARAQRSGCREPRSTPVQQAGRAVVDASTAAMEDASLAISRWCRSRDCRRMATPGRPSGYCRCCCWSHCSCLSPSPCPYPCLCHRCWGWGRKGKGRLRAWWFLRRRAQSQLLRARSRTRWPVPRPLSGLARSPRVRGRYGRCGRRGTTATA
jgi:hypothetical protein